MKLREILNKSNNKKFELIIAHDGLYRIRALKDFGDVKAGDLGGFVRGEKNLSHEGNAWIYDNAKVTSDAYVCDDAVVYGHSLITGRMRISGKACIGGWAQIAGDSEISGNISIKSPRPDVGEPIAQSHPRNRNAPR